MENLARAALDVIAAHPEAAAAVMFVAAFGESFAFVSLFFPGTSLVIAAGALMAQGALPQLPIIAGAVLGAVLGDGVSFWIGRRWGGAVARLWPFAARPRLLPGGIRFFERHGGKSVFFGRFLGPVRAVIPLAAGILGMPRGRFWIANIASALIWAPLLLYFGDGLGRLGDRLIGTAYTAILVLLAVVVFGVAGLVWAIVRTGARPD